MRGKSEKDKQVSINQALKTLKRLFKYMKASKILLVLALLAAVIGTLMQVVTPKILGGTTDLIVKGMSKRGQIDFSALISQLLLVGSLMVGGFLMNVFQQRIMLIVSQKITLKLRTELKEKMNRLPLSYFDKMPNGKLMSIAINDIENIVSSLQSGLTELFSNGIMLIGVVFFIFSISWQLSLVALILIPLSLLVLKGLTPKSQKHNRKYMALLGDLNTQIEETYQGLEVIKSFNQETTSQLTFNKTNEQMYESGWKAQVLGGSMMPLIMAIQNGVYVLLAALGGYQVLTGRLSIGNMQAFLQYSSQFSSPVIHVGQIWGELLSAAASVERVFQVLDEEELVQYVESFENHPSASQVSFQNVAFSYDDSPLLTDFSLEIQQGEKIAIVGQTGAGKSTIINLLERFYEIQSGKILIDGVDTRNYELTELRSKLALVLQDTWLFSGSIYDNLTYGSSKVTKAEVYQGAKESFAADFIEKLPDGYDTLLTEEGGNISQGQKQLLTIARALIMNPEILILDEATSNVDSRTELLIQQGMEELMKGRTSFVVAHRLSTIYDADRIIVMAAGQIVEIGSHQELLEKAGAYSEIYHSQFVSEAA